MSRRVFGIAIAAVFGLSALAPVVPASAHGATAHHVRPAVTSTHGRMSGGGDSGCC